MASKVEIMNLALLNLGDEIILSEDEDTKAARTMRALWDATVLEVLADHTWGFAKKRATLDLLTETPEYEWSYAYQLPNDYVRMVHLGEPDDDLEWVVEDGKLLTNETSANITYIYEMTTPGKWSPKFVTALATLLAAYAGRSIAGLETKTVAELKAEYRNQVADAATVDSQNQPSRIDYPKRWVNARY